MQNDLFCRLIIRVDVLQDFDRNIIDNNLKFLIGELNESRWTLISDLSYNDT